MALEEDSEAQRGMVQTDALAMQLNSDNMVAS